MLYQIDSLHCTNLNEVPTPARLTAISRKQSISSMPRFGQITQSTLLVVGQWAQRQVVSVAIGLQRGARSLAIVLSLLLVARFQHRRSHGSTFKEERFLFDVVIERLV